MIRLKKNVLAILLAAALALSLPLPARAEKSKQLSGPERESRPGSAYSPIIKGGQLFSVAGRLT